MGLEPASVRAFTLSNMNISETGGLMAIKFYMKHHCGRGKAALGFGADLIRTLVLGERGGSVVECRTPEREVGGSKPTAAVLCP